MHRPWTQGFSMPRGPKRPADVVGAAVMVAKIATGEIEDETSPMPARAKGGKKGGKARAEALDPQTRREIARKAANARFRYCGFHLVDVESSLVLDDVIDEEVDIHDLAEAGKINKLPARQIVDVGLDGIPALPRNEIGTVYTS